MGEEAAAASLGQAGDPCEGRAATAEEALHDPDLYARDPSQFSSLTQKIEQLRADKDAAEMRWLEVAELAESLAR